MHGRQAGFTLVEVLLSVAVGVLILGASVYAYQSVKSGASISQAKSMVGTIQTNIGMEKFRLGTPPPMTPAPSASAALSLNQDSTGKAYWPNTVGSPNTLPDDPVLGQHTLLQFDSTQSPVPLVAGAPTPQWDNPVFGSPGYGTGGWLYDPNTGAFRINLSNQAYPADRPGTW